MALEVYVMEAANLVCTDLGNESQPGKSTALVLNDLKLPGWEENYVEYSAGGSTVNYEVNTNFNHLESTFTLHGWQPEIMGLVATGDYMKQVFTAYGLIRHKRSGAACRAVAVMRGRLGRANPTPYRRGDLQNLEYSIRGIWKYELQMARGPGNELQMIYDWDFFAPRFVVWGPDGNPYNVNADLENTIFP